MWPSLARHLFLPAHEMLLLRPTLSIARRLARDDGWTADAVARHQADGRERLARHALAATAYWRGRAQREPIAPTGLDFPLLTRDEIARHREAMRWPEAPGRLIRDTSSGTTDDSLVFYVDRERQAWDRALRLHALARLGIEPGERQLHIWPEYTGGPFGRLKALLRATRDRFTNDPVFDLRPMTPERLDAALAFLDRWRPAVVLGYPSWLHALAQRRLRHGRGGWTPRRVVTTAELLYDFQRRAIESAFGAPVAEEYGSQGVGLIAGEDGDRRWRVHWQQVQVELLDAAGRPARPGEIGQVVVTNLHSHAMPFIRFATGDVARATFADDPAAPATMPRIAGRTADLVVAADGRLQDNRELIDAVVRETGATEFALHQPAPERLVVLAADPDSGAGPARGPAVELLRSMLGRSLRVDWRVGAFCPTDSGKRRYVCSPVGQALLAHDGEAAVERSRGWPQRVFTSVEPRNGS